MTAETYFGMFRFESKIFHVLGTKWHDVHVLERTKHQNINVLQIEFGMSNRLSQSLRQPKHTLECSGLRVKIFMYLVPYACTCMYHNYMYLVSQHTQNSSWTWAYMISQTLLIELIKETKCGMTIHESKIFMYLVWHLHVGMCAQQFSCTWCTTIFMYLIFMYLVK